MQRGSARTLITPAPTHSTNDPSSSIETLFAPVATVPARLCACRTPVTAAPRPHPFSPPIGPPDARATPKPGATLQRQATVSKPVRRTERAGVCKRRRLHSRGALGLIISPCSHREWRQGRQRERESTRHRATNRQCEQQHATLGHQWRRCCESTQMEEALEAAGREISNNLF